jgi:hypothetical protein
MNPSLFSTAKRLLPDIIRWHFARRPLAIMREYKDYASALAGVFSFVYLLRTLFSPWKAIADQYPSRGFNLAEIGSVFALNMTARCIGAFIRVCVIIAGIAAEIVCLAFFIAYFVAWTLFPILLPLSLLTFLATVFA